MALVTFRDAHDEISRVLREHGCLGAVLVDLAPLAQIERSFGGATYSSLRSQIEPVLTPLPAPRARVRRCREQATAARPSGCRPDL